MTDTNKDSNKIEKKEILSVDTPWCIGCWACVWLCSDMFVFNNDHKSIVKKQPETKEEIDCAKQAESVCPVSVIHVKD